MIRKEFIDIVTNTGMATLKEMKRLSISSDEEINEFDLLQMPYFDENKFSKLCAEKFSLTYIDLRTILSWANLESKFCDGSKASIRCLG